MRNEKCFLCGRERDSLRDRTLTKAGDYGTVRRRDRWPIVLVEISWFGLANSGLLAAGKGRTGENGQKYAIQKETTSGDSWNLLCTARSNCQLTLC